jgi:hypothetical protein
MVSLTSKQAKILLVLAALAVLGLILYVTYRIFSALAEFISCAGSVLVCFVCVWLLGRSAVKFIVFPGSFWIWRRNIESRFCKEMASQISQRIHDLRVALEILLDSSNEHDKTDFLPRSYEASGQAKRMLLVIGETFDLQKTEGTIKPRQQKLLDLISGLIQMLTETRLILSNSDEMSLWDWLDAESDESDWLNVVFEDFPNNTSANTALHLCTQIEEVLLESFAPTTALRSLKRWLFDNTLGSLDQMRVELKSRYHAEQVWITSDDNKTIDCLWFMADGSTPDTSTVLICNPNAGFYEFAYYQSEWLEFYLGNGINVFMWNYRGYGRSMGRPSPKSLQRDAEVIARYLKQSRGVIKLGMHGESLGGCIATHVAQTCKVDFLFADRSLSSLADVAKFNFGWLVHLLFCVFAPDWKFESAAKFIGADCFKIISCDPRDSVISDLASLKTGVAVKSIEFPQKFSLAKHEHILTPIEFNEFFKRLDDIMKMCSAFNRAEFERSPRGSKLVTLQSLETSQNTSTYQLLSKETETMDDEAFNALIYYICNVTEQLDAGGMSLASVFHCTNQRASLNAWLLVLEVWGSSTKTSPGEIGLTRQCAIERLRGFIAELQRLHSDHEFLTTPSVIRVCASLKVLLACFIKILSYLESRLDSSRSSKAGILLPLECGHSGPYSASERFVYQVLLSQHGFIAN